MRFLYAASIVALLSVSACARSSGAPGHTPPASPQTAAAFDHGEDEILRDLAAIDPRLARRAHVTASEKDRQRVTMAAVLREDSTVAIVDGAIDPFSFDARLRGLETASSKVASLPQTTGDARARERELLGRLVDSERARLDEERILPRSASALVRAIVDTWHAPTSPEDAATTDSWLTRRLRELREAMASSVASTHSLDVVRARELDDALDALEHLASTPGFVTATQELVRVRDVLEEAASRPAAKAQSDWEPLARRLRAHLGIEGSPEALARRYAELEVELRARATKAIAESGANLDTLSSGLEGHVFAHGACVDAVPGSRVRSMVAPQEREPACQLRHFIARTEGPHAVAIMLTAMHDHVVVAQWALDVARGSATIADAEAHQRMIVPASPSARARFERIALARPVAAIGGAEASAILLADDAEAIRTRAAAWSSLGDIPLDVARRDLAGARP